MYLRLIVHLKNILIGSDNIVKPNIHKNAYRTGPYVLYISFNHVLLKINGNANKYPNTTRKPNDSRSKILAVEPSGVCWPNI